MNATQVRRGGSGSEDPADGKPPVSPAESALSRYAPVGLAAAAMWLGWQIVVAPIAATAPPEIAVRLAPASASALQKAAEAELAAGRTENASDLAVIALRAAPFNAAALRVAGLSIVDRNRDRADQILTLSGNLSLRDTPTHAWLVEQRLRQGSYASAFGHADTLARRNADFQPRIFALFTAAAANDARAIRPLVQSLETLPPWRAPYLARLTKGPGANADVLGSLALAMQTSKAPLTDAELGSIFSEWVKQGRIDAVRIVRQRLGRPAGADLVDGGFSDTSVIAPFGWTVSNQAGLVAEIVPDDTRQSQGALRVLTDRFSAGEAARQLVMLKPGSWTMSGVWRNESSGDSNLDWTVRCLESGALLARFGPGENSAGAWQQGLSVMRPFSFNFTVPSGDCRAQTLTLSARPGERRSQTQVWFDNMELTGH